MYRGRRLGAPSHHSGGGCGGAQSALRVPSLPHAHTHPRDYHNEGYTDNEDEWQDPEDRKGPLDEPTASFSKEDSQSHAEKDKRKSSSGEESEKTIKSILRNGSAGGGGKWAEVLSRIEESKDDGTNHKLRSSVAVRALSALSRFRRRSKNATTARVAAAAAAQKRERADYIPPMIDAARRNGSNGNLVFSGPIHITDSVTRDWARFVGFPMQYLLLVSILLFTLYYCLCQNLLSYKNQRAFIKARANPSNSKLKMTHEIPFVELAYGECC